MAEGASGLPAHAVIMKPACSAQVAVLFVTLLAAGGWREPGNVSRHGCPTHIAPSDHGAGAAVWVWQWMVALSPLRGCVCHGCGHGHGGLCSGGMLGAYAAPAGGIERVDGHADYYAVLGIGRGATAKQMKKAYRRRSVELHPDKHPASEKEEWEDKFVELVNAYQVLSDPDSRARYDAGETDDSVNEQYRCACNGWAWGRASARGVASRVAPPRQSGWSLRLLLA